ncbi:MAG: hypothetical protein CME25_11955 [Gemmatimonadetes bacterium]|nr:hypothetical protein [Gemmatimonadota bacterium]
MKCVDYYGPDDTEELYNLETDLNEIKNLAGEADVCLIQKDLRTAVDQWWFDTGGKDAEFYETEAFKARGRK